MIPRSPDALQYFACVKGGLGACERVGGSGWRFAFNERECAGFDAEPFEVCSRELEIDLVASVIDMGDFKWGIGTRDGDLVADAGHIGASDAEAFLRDLP